MKEATPRAARPVVPHPPGLRATRLVWRGAPWLVLSFPLRPPPTPTALTEAEASILEGLVAGDLNQDLARARGTSARTIANQVGAIFRKLGVSSRAELLAKLHRGRP